MNAPLWEVAYSPDSKFLMIRRDKELEVRLTSNDALISRYDVTEFAVSPIRNLLALGDDEGNIQIREIDTGKRLMTIKAHKDPVYSIAFSGKVCDIKLWELESGKLLHYFEETAVDAYDIDMSSLIFYIS